MKFKKPVLLLLSLLVTFLTAWIGSSVTFPSIASWYVNLTKPAFSPPNWLFGPVWTVLYIMMATSLYLIWREGFKKNGVRYGVILFFIHLILNASWSIVFFGFRDPRSSLIVISGLWIMIVYLISLFTRINKTAGLLLVPYLLWVSFATVLNYSVWILNR